MIHGLLFDMDDTLFDELDYVRSGLLVVAERIASHNRHPFSDIYAFMMEELQNNGRDHIINNALITFVGNDDPAEVQNLVSVYRSHKASLILREDVRQLLCRLRMHYRLAIVTDGLTVMQKNKVVSLGLNDLVDEIVYCWELGAPKPNPQGFEEATARLGLKHDQVVVIGDHPINDIQAAQSAGLRSIRVRTGSFAVVPSPVGLPECIEIASLNHLEDCLAHYFSSNLHGR